MSFRRALLIGLGLVGLVVAIVGLYGYSTAWATRTDDPASVLAASRAAMRHLPIVAYGLVLILAAAIGWWRDRER